MSVFTIIWWFASIKLTLVIRAKLVAAILGGRLFGGNVLPAHYCPCGRKKQVLVCCIHWCECVVAGNLNVNLDSLDVVASRLRRFITDCSLVRCDDIFPLQKSVTYVNLALSHQSCIDYILTSADRSVNLRFWTRTLTFRIIFRCWLSYHVPI